MGKSRLKYFRFSFAGLILMIPEALGCGAIEGKGLRCTLATVNKEIASEENKKKENYFYFKNLEVLEPYLDVNQNPLVVLSRNHGPYELTADTMSWDEGRYLVDRDTWDMVIVSSKEIRLNCQLLAAPLRKIMDHYQPQIDALALD